MNITNNKLLNLNNIIRNRINSKALIFNTLIKKVKRTFLLK
jgi:hypothetical protein